MSFKLNNRNQKNLIRFSLYLDISRFTRNKITIKEKEGHMRNQKILLGVGRVNGKQMINVLQNLGIFHHVI